MIGGQHRPYAEPAAGTVLCGKGKAFQHAKADEKNIPFYEVIGYIYQGQDLWWTSPSLLPLPTGTDGCGQSCSGIHDWRLGYGVPTGTCGPWMFSGVGEPLTGPPLPKWRRNGTIDLSQCNKTGKFKNVQAGRNFHGRPGFLSNAIGDFANIVVCHGTDPAVTFAFCRNFQGAGDLLRYRTMICRITRTIIQEDLYAHTTDTQSAYFEGGCTVNKYTGNSSAYSTVDPNPARGYDWVVESLPVQALYCLDATKGLGSAMQTFTGCFYKPVNNDYVFTTYPSSDGHSVSGKSTSRLIDDNIIEDWSASSGGGFFRHVYGYSMRYSGDPPVGEWYRETIQTNSLALMNDSWTWTYTMEEIPAGPGNEDEHGIHRTETITVVCTLSDKYHFDEVFADMFSLAGTWNMADDVLYPWRNDLYYGRAPLVVRKERSETGPVLLTTDGTPYVGADDYLFDGSVIGAPQPAGYDYVFDFQMSQYIDCTDSNGEPFKAEAWSGEGNSIVTGLPRSATHWTNNRDMYFYAPGWWVSYNRFWNGAGWTQGLGQPRTLMMQKWAETKLPWASINFARPAGADRFRYDETDPDLTNRVFCVASQEENIVALEDMFHAPLTAGRLVVHFGDVWGGECVDGFYHITQLDDTTVRLDDKVYDVPTGWDGRVMISGDADSAFGKLRWPGCPGILGRVAVTPKADVDGNFTGHFTCDGEPYYVTGDRFKFSDRDGNVIAANEAVMRISDGEFSITPTASTFLKAKWVEAVGAPPWYMNDMTCKGDFIWLEFGSDWRSQSEAQRQNQFLTENVGGIGLGDLGDHGAPMVLADHNPYNYGAFTQTAGSIAFTPCNPSMLCGSPNGESFPHGITRPFNLTGNKDVTPYGWQWHGMVCQNVYDPFAQNPHHPCGLAAYAWNMDDGTGSLNSATQIFYPMIQQVEPRLAVRTNYGLGQNETGPALPTGVVLGFNSPVDHADDHTAHIPQPGTYMPWHYYGNLCACITATSPPCRSEFSIHYRDWMICFV